MTETCRNISNLYDVRVVTPDEFIFKRRWYQITGALVVLQSLQAMGLLLKVPDSIRGNSEQRK